MDIGGRDRSLFVCGEKCVDDALLVRAEAAGLVLVLYPDGSLSVFGDQDADDDLMREVSRHRDGITAAIRGNAEAEVARHA